MISQPHDNLYINIEKPNLLKKQILQDFDHKDALSRLKAKNEFDGHLVYGSRRFHETTHRSTATKDGPADGHIHKEQKLVVKQVSEGVYKRIAEFWEDVTECPVCNSLDRDFFVSRFALDIYACRSCTHHYMHPRIKFKKLVQLYAHDQTAKQIYISKSQVDIDVVKSKYGLKLIDKLGLPDKNRILDIGCGSGKFLDTALKHGWRECVGVDANTSFGDFHASNGVKYIYSDFESLDLATIGSGFSAITLWNVLEHLYDLKSIVGQLKSQLKDQGLLFVMVPNVTSLATKIIREKSATFNWKHVAHFSPKSLRKLMEDSGFKTVLVETAISEIENIKSYMNGYWPYCGHGDPDGHFDWITPQFLDERMMGSRLIGVFRK